MTRPAAHRCGGCRVPWSFDADGHAPCGASAWTPPEMGPLQPSVRRRRSWWRSGGRLAAWQRLALKVMSRGRSSRSRLQVTLGVTLGTFVTRTFASGSLHGLKARTMNASRCDQCHSSCHSVAAGASHMRWHTLRATGYVTLPGCRERPIPTSRDPTLLPHIITHARARRPPECGCTSFPRLI